MFEVSIGGPSPRVFPDSSLKSLGVNVVHIESRPSRRRESEYDVLVNVECDNKTMDQLVVLLRQQVQAINLKQYDAGEELPPPTPSSTASFGE